MERRRGGGGKKLAALLGTATAVVGLLTGALTLWDRLFSEKDEPRDVVATTGTERLRAAAVSQLSDGVQLRRFQELLGPPLSQERLQGGGEHTSTTWASTDLAVIAYSDTREQVVAYTVTSLSPGFNPAVEQVRGGVRLGSSVFADVRDDPQGIGGVYPPNGQWSYMELYGGGYATKYKQAVLAASWTANAKDAAATKLAELDCLPYSIFEQRSSCDARQLEPLRAGLHVTSMTIGEPNALKALESEGASFFATADASQ